MLDLSQKRYGDTRWLLSSKKLCHWRKGMCSAQSSHKLLQSQCNSLSDYAMRMRQ